MKRVKYFIIGAGISGLSFAYHKTGDDYVIVEKEKSVGGLCKSFYSNGFVWDVAGHFFHFHSEETKKFYEELMANKVQRTVNKCAKVYYNGQYINAPFQYNIHQLPTNEFLECLTDLYFADSLDNTLNFDEFVRSKYGKGIANKFLIPYNEKLYACSLNKLERDSMGGFLPKLDFDMLMSFYRGTEGNTYNDTFCYPVNGCMEFINSLIEKLELDRICVNEAVEHIDIDNHIVYTSKGEYLYEYLINTSPLCQFAKMIGNEEAEELNYNQVLVFNIGFDKESLDKKISWAYFPGDEIFYRVGFYNNIAATERLSIYVEISYKANDIIDIGTAFEKTLADLKRVGIISGHKVVAYNHYIINPGYSHITARGREYTQNLEENLKEKNIFLIGRYAKWQYSAMDDSLEQALDLSTKI